jgi:cytochrome c-type biogenesis protein CcmH
MASFWILAALMTAVALAFVLVPLLRSRPRVAPSTREANLEVLRAQRREIDADVAAGTLAPEARDEALSELVSRAGSDLDAASAEDTKPQRKPWIVAGITATAMAALAFGLYAAVGNPGAMDAKPVAAAADTHDQARMVQLVDMLAIKMRDRPDDATGMALLARSQASLGRFKEAAEAYERLVKIVPDDPQALADYADVLAMVQGRNLAGRPYELAKAALKIDPSHRKALALAGTAAMDTGDYAAARGYWQRIIAQVPPDAPERAELQVVLDEINQRAAAAGKALPPSSAPATVAQAPKGGGSVSGSVTLAPSMASKVAGDEVLFVFARDPDGPRMPLATLRKSVR